MFDVHYMQRKRKQANKQIQRRYLELFVKSNEQIGIVHENCKSGYLNMYLRCEFI